MEFEDLELSNLTLKALEELGYKKLTSIQKICILPALNGRDVLGSGKTGSGKTLCFVIPIIEKLWSKQWSNLDAIGGCVICPIRELGVQIFEVMRTVSFYHSFGVRALIGGNFIKKNKKSNKKFSIMIATPSSLLNLISSEKFFTLDYLEILTLDEIDKILDMGFQRVFSSILKFISEKKQTLVFSATLTKKIRNVTRLNLVNPVFCKVRKRRKTESKKSEFPEAPSKLFQYYLKVNLNEKINILFSFLKSHQDQKIIVFFSSRKQVGFFYYIFKALLPNCSFFFIYGNMNQKKRASNFIFFNQSKKGILFTTDLVSRGVDFKSIDWVVQADCPHDVETYLHRIGRAGRFNKEGKSVLLIGQQEIFFLNLLNSNNIKIFQMRISKGQIVCVSEKISLLVRQNRKLNILGNSAFLNYTRFIISQKNKKIFRLNKSGMLQMAKSFGLV
mmetsp:Transcript_39353/g.80613  ORF Transcript_39353/g.80613 Transcript_39353/m.80613 type:complete len:446 (+) Transcript_39353:25-1362(+)